MTFNRRVTCMYRALLDRFEIVRKQGSKLELSNMAQYQLPNLNL